MEECLREIERFGFSSDGKKEMLSYDLFIMVSCWREGGREEPMSFML